MAISRLYAHTGNDRGLHRKAFPPVTTPACALRLAKSLLWRLLAYTRLRAQWFAMEVDYYRLVTRRMVVEPRWRETIPVRQISMISKSRIRSIKLSILRLSPTIWMMMDSLV